MNAGFLYSYTVYRAYSTPNDGEKKDLSPGACLSVVAPFSDVNMAFYVMVVNHVPREKHQCQYMLLLL